MSACLYYPLSGAGPFVGEIIEKGSQHWKIRSGGRVYCLEVPGYFSQDGGPDEAEEFETAEEAERRRDEIRRDVRATWRFL